MFKDKKGPGLGGIVFSLGTIAFMAAVAVPRLIMSGDASQLKVCHHHQQSLIEALDGYERDHPRAFIDGVSYEELRDSLIVEGYVRNINVFECPSSDGPQNYDDYEVLLDENYSLTGVRCLERAEHNVRKSKRR